MMKSGTTAVNSGQLTCTVQYSTCPFPRLPCPGLIVCPTEETTRATTIFFCYCNRRTVSDCAKDFRLKLHTTARHLWVLLVSGHEHVVVSARPLSLSAATSPSASASASAFRLFQAVLLRKNRRSSPIILYMYCTYLQYKRCAVYATLDRLHLSNFCSSLCAPHGQAIQ